MDSDHSLRKGIDQLARALRPADDIRRARRIDQAITNDGNPILPQVLHMGSRWDGPHVVMGLYHLWIDESDRLRMKKGNPTSDTDGQVVGGQS